MDDATPAGKVLEVVVIDDVCRFALYVWRYLSRCVGFGTGDIPNDGGQTFFFWRDGKPTSLDTPAGDARVWWVNSRGRAEGGSWEEQLEAVLERLGEHNRRCFLVDVRGHYHSPHGPASTTEDALQQVIQRLVERGVDVPRDVLLVSSYQTSPFEQNDAEPMRIHPKAPETFERLCERLGSPWRTRSIRETPAVHILVTGAGFELKADLWRLGTRPTDGILKTALMSLFEGGLTSDRGFCLPSKHQGTARFQRAAQDFDLDGYWDELLMLEILEKMASAEDGGRPDKSGASQREYELRESFRRQLLADDWGFLSQAVDALRMPGLAAWITTNYTRFADRAIEVWSARAAASSPGWRIVSTISEAERLLRELLHEPDGEKQKKRETGKRHRFLFKLHGDLAHLLTMALAGHDKEIFSPLSLPIGSLHVIYTAAEQSLLRLLKLDAPGTVFWHIVGHGLRDNLLLRLIRHVCQETRPSRHRFLVANPDPDGPSERLRKVLKGLRMPSTAVVPLKLQADQYLARLPLVDLPSDARTMAPWIERLKLP